MENNLRLFEKLWIKLKLNNSGVHLSFARSDCTKVLRISHEGAVGSKQKMVGDKFYHIIISMFSVTTETCGGGCGGGGG